MTDTIPERAIPDVAECSVLIVGAGPVGLALANILGAAGVSTVVLERSVASHGDPRAVHFDGEIMRVFQSLGLAAEMESVTLPVERMTFEDEEGVDLISIDWGTELGSQGWRQAYLFHQPDLEGVLQTGAERYADVRLVPGHEVTSIEEAEGHVLVGGVDASGASFTVRSTFVVGCDGASSMVRRHLDSRWEILGPAQPWLVVDGTVTGPSGLPDHPVQYPWPARPHYFMRNVDDRVRWEFKLMPGDDPETLSSPASVQDLIRPMAKTDQVDIQRAAVYTFRSHVASRWGSRRVFIAGDAAHLQPPFMAQGMCSGIRDVSNLGWKLTTVLDGASPDLLATYQSEREPHAMAWIREATRVSELCQLIDAEVAHERNQMLRDRGGSMAPLIPGLGEGLHAAQPAPAGQLSDQPMTDAGLRLDDLSRGAFAVCSDGRLDLTGLEKAIAQVTVLTSVDSDLVQQILTRYDDAAVLVVRPDGYILGAARTQEEANDLLSLVP